MGGHTSRGNKQCVVINCYANVDENQHAEQRINTKETCEEHYTSSCGLGLRADQNWPNIYPIYLKAVINVARQLGYRWIHNSFVTGYFTGSH